MKLEDIIIDLIYAGISMCPCYKSTQSDVPKRKKKKRNNNKRKVLTI